MLFIRKSKVDEDVEKIRQYTLGSEALKQEMDQEIRKKAELDRKRKEISEEWTWKDVLAMTIAIIQVILPYFIVMFLGMGLVFLYFIWRGSGG